MKRMIWSTSASAKPTWIYSERRFKLLAVPRSTTDPANRGSDRHVGTDDAPPCTVCTLSDGNRHIPMASFAATSMGCTLGVEVLVHDSLFRAAAAAPNAQSCIRDRSRALALHDMFDSLDGPSSGPHAVSTDTADAHWRMARILRLPNGCRCEYHAR